MAEIIEIDWFKFILEDHYNFFLLETCKPNGYARHFKGDLSGDIIIFCY